MLFIKYVLRIPLRMSEENLLIGDDAIHGESAYTFGEGFGLAGWRDNHTTRTRPST